MGRGDIDKSGKHVPIARRIEFEEFIGTILCLLGDIQALNCLIINLPSKRINFAVPLRLDLPHIKTLRILNVPHDIDWINITILDLLIDKNLLVGWKPVRRENFGGGTLIKNVANTVNAVEYEN